MMNVFLSISWSLLVLFLWYETSAFHEYLRRVPLLNKFLGFKEYDENKKYYDHCSYQEFLSIHYDNFLVKLISCPYCLSFWTSLVTTLYFTRMEFLPVIYMSSILAYLSLKKLLALLNN